MGYPNPCFSCPESRGGFPAAVVSSVRSALGPQIFETLGQFLPRAAVQHCMWDVSGICAHLCHAARAVPTAPCKNVHVFVPKSAFPAQQVGICTGKPEWSYQVPLVQKTLHEVLKNLLLPQVQASSMSFCAILLWFEIFRSLGSSGLCFH